MASNDINIDILINAGQASKTLKEQREALLKINDALKQVKDGSGAFELLTEEATRLQKSMGVLNTTFEETYGNIQPLTGRLGELEDKMYELALAGKQNTEEFKTLQTEAIKMRRTIVDVDETVDAFAQKGARLQGFIGIAQGIAGGFAVAQSAAALFGSENENLEKSIAGVANVIGVLSGLEALSTSIKQKNVIIDGIQNGIRLLTIKLVGQETVAKAAAAATTGTATLAQKALNLAMAANPVGLLIVGITALISALVLFGDETEDNKGKQEQMNAEFERTIQLQQDLIDRTAAVSDYNIQRAELEGKSIKEIADLRLKAIEDEERGIQDLYDLTIVEIKRLSKSKDAEDKAEAERLKKQNNELKKKLSIDETFMNSFEKRRELVRIKYIKDEKDAQDKIREENKKTAEQRKKELEEFKKQQAEYKKAFEQNAKEREKLESELIFELKNLRSTEFQKSYLQLQDNINKEADLLKEKAKEDIKLNNDALAKKLISDKEYLDKKAEIDANYMELSFLLRLKSEKEFQDLIDKNGKELTDITNANLTEQFNQQMNALDKELELRKASIKKEKELNKELSSDKKRTLEQEVSDLEKQVNAQNDLVIKRETERAGYLSKINEARSTEERELYQGIINDIDALQVKTKQEIDTNGNLLNSKKEQLTLNEKLYGDEKKQKEELDKLDTDIFSKKKKLAEDFRKVAEKNLKEEYEFQKTIADEEIKRTQEKEDFRKFEINNLQKFIDEQTSLLEGASDAQTKIITENIENNTKEQQALELLLKGDVTAKQKALEDKKALELKYNKDVVDLAASTTEKVNKEEEERTEKTKEELDKRKADLENFVANTVTSSLGLLNAILDASIINRISLIEQESQIRLDAIEAEKQAYVASITEETNAEKFKRLKLKEFDDKKALEEKKRDKEKAEAQYKGEIRKWEFSQAEAVVNLANAMLKAAPNPFLLATTGILGILELATITANKPVKPKFAKGGLLDGPSHAQGGIQTPFGEMEGGEAVINKKSTKMFLPILSQLNQAGGGVPFISTPKMASGGITNNISVNNDELAKILDEWSKRPIKTYVVSTDVTSAQTIDTRINKRTSF